MRQLIYSALGLAVLAHSVLAQQPACPGSSADAEMRSAALDGLRRMDASDAMPILTGVLKQRDPCRAELRKQAVSLLARKAGDDALPMLLDVVRNDPSDEVKNDAVFWLSRTASDFATSALDSILFSAGNSELRNTAIFALSRRESPRAAQSLKRAAEDEKMPAELRGQAAFWLGRQRLADLDYFKKLYTQTKNEEVRGQVIQAVVNLKSKESGQWLLDLAKDKSQDTESRKNAIFWASKSTSLDLDQLAGIYAAARSDQEIQNQVLFVYSRRSEPAAVDKLIAIARTDDSIEMRKEALFWLGRTDDPRARQLLKDLITK